MSFDPETRSWSEPVPDWWPDWRGKAVAIVACGPSAKAADPERLIGRMPVLAIKEAFYLCRYPDVVYGCDAAWWRWRVGLKNWSGVKVTQAGTLTAEFPDLHLISVAGDVDQMMMDKPDVIGGGGNSGFQALNLAVQWGAARVLLVGFDCRGEHFYGTNNWSQASNPGPWNFSRWTRAFDIASRQLTGLGVTVINTGWDTTAIRSFRLATLDETLKEWT